jgi:hypothetical protein
MLISHSTHSTFKPRFSALFFFLLLTTFSGTHEVDAKPLLPCTLHIEVRSAGSMAPIEGALVKLMGSSHSSSLLTDTNGIAEFDSINCGNYDIRATKDGYTMQPEQYSQKVIGWVAISFLGTPTLPSPTPTPTPTGTPAPSPTPTPAPTTGNNFYASPAGSAAGRGSIDNPWDLRTALSQSSIVKPGDTIWLRNGTSIGTFVSYLVGTQTAPITVRQYPGERAIIDKGSGAYANGTIPSLAVRGAWVTFWGFEITNSYADRSRTNPNTGLVQPWRGDGVDVYAPNVKFVNMVIHDAGIGIYDKQDGTEIYGCVFFYNGNNKNEHALYLGNRYDTKLVADNIIFDQGGYGIHSYSASTTSAQSGLTFEGNAVFNNGILTLDDMTTMNFLVGGEAGVPAERITIRDNYIYAPPGNKPNKNIGVMMGYADQGNRDLTITGNYIVAGQAQQIRYWQNVISNANTVYSTEVNTSYADVDLKMPAGVSTSAYSWNNNTYFGGLLSGGQFLFNLSTPIGFATWQLQTGLDANSELIQNLSLRPNGVQTFVRPNKYEAGRGHIVVYNWNHNATVTVDVAAVGLKVGDQFEVIDAQNYFGTPVTKGTYDGNPINVPMNLTIMSRPVGNVERVPSHTSPEFAAFIIRRL